MSKHQDFQQLSLFPEPSQVDALVTRAMGEVSPARQHLRLISSGPGISADAPSPQDEAARRCIESELVNRVMFF
ncbi:hypothetical protein [Roseateles sp.]|uniref:hypothetical protein n=1 Tax=Roseateles sp. TaxID=1971397 RepID=UPI002F3F9E94